MTTLPTVRRQLVNAAEGIATARHPREHLRPLLGWALAAASLAVVAVVVIAIGSVRHETPTPTSSAPASDGPGLAAPVLKPGQAWYFTSITEQTTGWAPASGFDQPGRADGSLAASTRAATVTRAGADSWVLQGGNERGDTHPLGRARFLGSARDRALWIDEGSRSSVTLGTGPSETFQAGFQVGDRQLSYEQLLHFATDQSVVRRMFGGPPAQLQLTQIGQAFEYTPLPPAARATLLDLLAHLPGIEHVGTVRDPLGRPGIGFATAVPVGLRAPLIGGSSLPQRHELIFDPTTKALLADETVLLTSTRVPGIGAGYPVSWTAYLSSRAVAVKQVKITPPPCQQGSVQLEAEPQGLSGQLGEHAYLFTLTNQYGNAACTLTGYPSVGLSHDGRPLRFVYRDGSGPYVTARRPKTVTLRPLAHAYFVVAKYRCDGKIASVATDMNVGRIGLGGLATIELSANHITDLDYCARYPGDARTDPGNYVTVSPIERTVSATLAPPP